MSTPALASGWRGLSYWLMPELRQVEQRRREMEIRHAKERAALDAWAAECHRYLVHGADTPYLPPPQAELV